MKTIGILMLLVSTLISTATAQAQSKSFTDLSDKEKADFVTAKIDEITTKMSGKTFAFNADFKLQVTKYVDGYVKRIGSNRKTGALTQDLNIVFERGRELAPTINQIFDKNGVSRLSGLYVAMIESEFDTGAVSPTGSLGLFQISKSLAQKHKLSLKDRSDAEKSADLAARYLKDNQSYFAQHEMKEFLAILSWNRGAQKVNFDLNFKFMSDTGNIACPICGLTANPTRFDQQFQTESVRYIPKFLAATIIGENPQSFNLKTKPLSAL